jgi:hypothetical protein
MNPFVTDDDSSEPAMSCFLKHTTAPQPTEPTESQYHALPSNETVRLMVLEAGKNDEPLVCTLASDLRKMLYYEAISYVWGSDDRDHNISCNGQMVKITTNLQEVLRSIRLPTGARTLWADSICINQEDVTEKDQQVSLMGQLFKQANRVLICVGSNNDGHAERFSSLLGELDDMVLKGIKKAGPSSDTFPRLDLESKEHLLSDERWHAIRSLVRLLWFR